MTEKFKENQPNQLSVAPEIKYAAKRIEYDNAGNIIYIGTSLAKASDTDPLWRIEKLEYGEHGVVRNYFPKTATGEANSFYNFKWSERENYEYV